MELTMHQRGKLVILLIFGIAFVLSAYAWWHHYRINARSKQFWGSRAMIIIRYGSKVEFLQLRPMPEETPEKLEPSSQRLAIGENRYSVKISDISESRGLVHARHALIDDYSYQWDPPGTDCEPNWEFGLRLSNESDQVTIVFDTNCGFIRWIEGEREARLVPESAAAFRKKRGDWQQSWRQNDGGQNDGRQNDRLSSHHR